MLDSVSSPLLLDDVEMVLAVKSPVAAGPELHAGVESEGTDGALETLQVEVMAGLLSHLLPHLETVATRRTLGAEHLEVVLPAVELAVLAVAGRLQLGLADVADQAVLVETEVAHLDDGLG